MSYALIDDNEIVEQYPYTLTDLRYKNKETSFPIYISNQLAEHFNVYEVQDTAQPIYDPITQNITASAQNIGGEWVQVWVVESATQEEIAQRELQQQQENKSQAESLLQATDWTATVDINDPQYSNPYLGNQPEFLAYRSQVRQIAVTPPTTPAVFPTKPEEVWVTV